MVAPAPPPDAARCVVLLWIGRLGDLLIATPAMAAVRRRYPGARIVLVTGERGEGAGRLSPDVDEVLVLRRFHRPLSNLALVRALVREEADVLVDLNSSFSRGAWTLAALARARWKLGFLKGRGDRVFSRTLSAPGVEEHMLDRYARLARELDAPFEPRLRIRLTEEDRRRAREVLRSLLPSALSGRGRRPPSKDGGPSAAAAQRSLVGVFPGNFKKFDNRWPEEKFAELTGRLDPGRLDLLYVAGPGEEKDVRGIVARLARPVPVVPPLPLGVLAALLGELDLLVTNATGTAHLAVAAGTPTFSILSRYTRTVWMPEGRLCDGVPHSSVVSASWDSCRDISVDEVFAKLTETLGKLGSRS